MKDRNGKKLKAGNWVKAKTADGEILEGIVKEVGPSTSIVIWASCTLPGSDVFQDIMPADTEVQNSKLEIE